MYRAIVKSRVEVERMTGGATGIKRALARPARNNLSWLAAVYGSDKGATAHRYVDLYERHLGDRRHLVTKVLEIGIYRGASLQMWRDFFPRAEVYGIDISEVSVDGPRIHTIQGDQSDPALLERVRDLGPFDVIIDDGSHRAGELITTFAGLFESVQREGFYVIEDMHTAYLELYGGGKPGHVGTSTELVKDLVDAVNRDYLDEGFPGAGRALPSVGELHVYPKIAFIQRGPDAASDGGSPSERGR
jgi:hypothetical protein